MDDEKNESHIDEIKQSLYKRGSQSFSEKWSKFKKKKYNVKDKWDDSDKSLIDNPNLYKYEKKGPTVFSFIFFGALVFFVFSIAFTFFFLFFFSSHTNNNLLTLSVIGPNTTKSGEVLDFQVKVDNQTDFDYKDLRVVVNYPDSTLSADGDFIKKEERKVGDLLSGETAREKFRVSTSGAIGDKREILISIFYHAKKSSATLSKKRGYNISIEDAPVFVESFGPNEVFSNKEFEVRLDVTSNAEHILKDLVVIAKYPRAFELKNAIPKAVFSDLTKNVFKIKELKPGETKSVHMIGKVFGLNKDNQFFLFDVGDSKDYRNEIRTLFAKTEKQLAIRKPDVSLSVAMDGQNFYSDKEILAQPKEQLIFKVGLSNNLDSLISDLEIKGTLTGEFFDKETVLLEDGFFDSKKNIMLWDKNTEPSLAALSGSQSFEKEFKMQIIPFEKLAGYVKDPEINLKMEVKGTNFDENSVKNSHEVLDTIYKTIKIPTIVNLESSILYYDGPFENTGSVDPKVGEQTTYTVAWKIYNSNSQIDDVTVKAQIPHYVEFLGVKSPENAYLSYDEDSRTITWSLKKVEEFIGYRTDPKTVYFQLGFTPSATQTGKRPIILKEQVLSAKDTFIDRFIEVKGKEEDTGLAGDSQRVFGMGVVVNE